MPALTSDLVLLAVYIARSAQASSSCGSRLSSGEKAQPMLAVICTV